MKRLALLLFVIACLLPTSSTSQATEEISLSTEGTTTYRIVPPASPGPADAYAVEKLALYLEEITGARFSIASPDEVTPEGNYLFVGWSPPMRAALGKASPEKLKPQESVVRSSGKNLFLFGEGIHGNLDAVMDFLENSLGWRWFSSLEKPVLPKRPTVALAPFNRSRQNSYLFRETASRFNMDFEYQHGINMGYDRKKNETFVSALPNEIFVHSLFTYIPPTKEDRHARRLPWLERKEDYFATHPDFFSQNQNGQRVSNMQLCFGNPALREELTKNILAHIQHAGEQNIITLDAMDVPGRFCYCPDCQALEEQYQSVGGPLYDYLFELCDLLKEKHPGTLVKTLAYRRSQTQKPPVLRKGERLPENLIVSFAPIEDNYIADWDHPDPLLQETFADLKAWAAITNHLWAWLYPNPFGSAWVMPLGNLRRNIRQIRIMKETGVEGLFLDHRGLTSRSGLAELQHYLFCKLMQDVDTDTDRHIKEFTDHFYGPAAPMVREYLEQLEKGREAMATLDPRVTHTSRRLLDADIFPYLTVESIHRWQRMFDQMEKLCTGDPVRLHHLGLLRRELDFATLWKWFPLHEKHGDYFSDSTVFSNRIEKVNAQPDLTGRKLQPLDPGMLEDFVAIIKGGGREKPLPAPFANIDPAKVHTFLPSNTANTKEVRQIGDADAARGYAVTVDKPDAPFELGFYQWISRNPSKGKPGARLKITNDQIVPGKYQLYRLGHITLAPESWIWFSARSWATHVDVGERAYRPGETNLWEAWVSMKFEGPTYGGKEKEDRVLVDRIILVDQSE
ncbi:MAG TPA: DUF4838 domain-containing protein [Chthoniobacteraceae bacterium]|nr:DUF4838 domain-containing protein [Chthoniobacteraceae bacterium]